MITRRQLIVGTGSLMLGGCLAPGRRAPVIDHVRYPMGLIPWTAGQEIRVGAAKIDITPPEGTHTWLAGFGFQRKMRELRDPISACAFYVDDGTRRLAIVVADVIGLMLPTTARVRRLVGNGIDVAVAATHNHQSPDTMGYWGRALLYALPVETGQMRAYQRVFERRLAACVALAARNARRAELRFARADIGAGLVRNLRTPGVYDPAIEVIAADDAESGEPLATFVSFGCHPETLGDRSRKMSADFPGRVRAKIEEARGGTAVFANGILGGMITPDFDDGLEEKERARVLENLGEQIAAKALATLDGVAPTPVDRLRYRRRAVELAVDNSLFKYVENAGLVEHRAPGKEGGLMTEVGRIDLGPASFALLPGEPTPKVGLRVKAALKAEHPIVLALAGDELGYILDPAEYDDEIFAYERSVSVGRETAPKLEEALAALSSERG
jgi:hypothetical protein